MHQIKLDNERAKFAFNKVSKVKSLSEMERKKDKYLISCRNAPSQMKVNGFGMTMAYLFSKEDSRYLYNDIVEWFREQFYQNDETVQGDEFLNRIVNLGSFEYMQMSKEAMALLVWMKRFAEGMLKND